MAWKKTYCIYLVFIFNIIKALAHPMPNSVVNLSVTEYQIKGEAKVPLIELENALGGSVQLENIQQAQHPCWAYFTQHIRAVSQQQSWQTTIEGIEVVTDKDTLIGTYQELIVRFRLVPPHTANLRDFDFHYDAIIHQVINHKILVYVQQDWQNGRTNEMPSQQLGVIEVDIVTGKIFPLHVQLATGSRWQGFVAMLHMGIQHIYEGLDHILFLLTLLIVAPLKTEKTHSIHQWSLFQGFYYTLKRFLSISIAFTIGHSVTLLLGTFFTFPIHSQYVEILIALSIAISAVHAMYPLFKHKEAWITMGFGLLHGLAFSYSLAHLDLSFSNKLISLLGFNLGIEIMQIVLMLLFFPVLLLSRYQFYHYLRLIFAVLSFFAAILWLLERMGY